MQVQVCEHKERLAKSRCAKTKAWESGLTVRELRVPRERQVRQRPGLRGGLPLYKVNLRESLKSLSRGGCWKWKDNLGQIMKS